LLKYVDTNLAAYMETLMRRLTLWALTLCGVGSLAYGISLLFISTPLKAQEVDLEDADYEGARECSSCHRALSRDHGESRHALTMQDVSRDDDLILGDFELGADVRMVTFPGDDSEPRPFEAGDIAYALGSGRNVQRYLYEVDRNEFMLLPAQWNVNTQAWEPYALAESWPDDAYAFAPNCAGCHTTGIDTRRFRWEDDGVQCEACHGPGSLHVEAADDDEDVSIIRASIVRSPDPQICGQCHSRGTEPEDGLPYPAEYRPGQADLLDEDVFVLVAPDDSAHWYADGHARQKYMQFNESLLSAHATALETMRESEFAADSCLQCHSGDYRWMQSLIAQHESGDREGDPPAPLTVETAQFGVTCINCHAPHGDGELDMPLLDEPYALCSDCHSNPPDFDSIHHPVREMFEGVTLVTGVEGTPSAHFAAEDGPRCLTCHMPDVPVEDAGLRASHLLKPIIPGEVEDGAPDACSNCHEDLTTSDLGSLVRDTQDRISERLSVAFARLSSMEVPEEGTAEREQYDAVMAALTFVQGDASLGVHNFDYTSALLKMAEQSLSELSVPGAVLQPTEGPAPTATPSEPITTVVVSGGESVDSPFRPMTWIIIALVIGILMFSAWRFFRKSEEA
jgi:hypothetical protein